MGWRRPSVCAGPGHKESVARLGQGAGGGEGQDGDGWQRFCFLSTPGAGATRDRRDPAPPDTSPGIVPWHRAGGCSSGIHPGSGSADGSSGPAASPSLGCHRAMPGSVSALSSSERSGTGVHVTAYRGVTAFRGGSVASSAASPRTALRKGRRGCSSLRSKSYARDSTVTSSELSSPQFWHCWDQDPSLNASKSTG